MGFKVLAVALNKEHAQTLTKIITKFVREHIQAGSARFLGNDGENRLKDTMPAKLRLWQEKNNNVVQMEDGDSIGTYLDGMRKMGTWIDTLMLFAASAVFKIQFVCLMPEPQLICAPSLVGQQSLLVCAIANLWHFWALEPKPPEEIVEPGGQAGHRG